MQEKKTEVSKKRRIHRAKERIKHECILRFSGFSTIFCTFQIDFHNSNTTSNLDSYLKKFSIYFSHFCFYKIHSINELLFLITSSYFRSDSSAISCASANCCSSVAIRSSSWYVRCSRVLRPLEFERTKKK